METKHILNLHLVLALFLLLTPSPATAHDDGLTCHEHPTSRPTLDVSFNFTEVEWEYYPEGSVSIGLLGHGLDNLVALTPDRYAPEDVVATHASLGEFEEMVGAVRRLVTRAERIADPSEAAHAFQLAEDTLGKLPLAEYLTIDDFLKENRDLSTVVVSFDVLLQYLRGVGTPDDLVEAVENSAAGC